VFTWLKAENSFITAQFVLPVISGVLLSLPWLGLPGWVLLFAIIPLLFSEKYFSETQQNFSLYLAGGITFLIWNYLSVAWTMDISFSGGLLIILINSFFMSAVFLIFSLSRRKLIHITGYFLLAVFWLSYEYYLIHGKPGWPWLVLGNGLGNSIRLVQWYRFTGVMGGSLWVLVVNILLFRFLSTRRIFETLAQLGFTIAIFLLILLFPIIGSFFLLNRTGQTGSTVPVSIVQTNIDPNTQKFSGLSNCEQFEKLMELTKIHSESKPDLVVWPETALDSLWLSNLSDERLLKMQEYLSEMEISLIFGAMSFKTLNGLSINGPEVRKSDSLEFVVSNSAILLDNEKLQEYKKNILVPGVETSPVFFHDIFSVNYFTSLGGVSGGLYSDYKKTNLILNDSVALIPTICFESANGFHISGFRQVFPFLIVILTNDGWFTRQHAYHQHLLMARLRAIENSAEVIRSANTGISAHIDKYGFVKDFIPIGEEGSILVQAGLSNNFTFYARSGDYIGRIALFLFVLAILFLLVQFLKTEKKFR
jgi:apolipoprotein N-acyltransferase